MDPLFQLNDSKNRDRYILAGKIASIALNTVIDVMENGKRIVDLCKLGDDTINNLIKDIDEEEICGIVFPTSISPTECGGFWSPRIDKPEKKDKWWKVTKGTIYKIELGVHINKFPAQVCYTWISTNGMSKSRKETVERLLNGIDGCSKEVLKNMVPGNSNLDISKIISKWASDINASLPIIHEEYLAPGTLSYQVSQGVMDGFTDDDAEFVHQLIMPRSGGAYDFTLAEIPLNAGEVWAIDILFSSGKGSLTRIDNGQICKRLPEIRKNLKFDSSRKTIREIPRTRFGINIDNNLQKSSFKLGLRECLKSQVVEMYPIWVEKDGEIIVRAKFTIIVDDKPQLIVAKSLSSQLDKIQKIEN